MKIKFCAAMAAAALFASNADAALLKFDSFTSSRLTVNVEASPIAGTIGASGASGFNMTDMSGGMGDFVAWCLDLGHTMMDVGGTQEYNVTSDPFSNSYSPSSVALGRIQALFDANYGDIDLTKKNEAGAFQMAIWEAAYEDDFNALDVNEGIFSATGSASLANDYLSNALAYVGPQKYNMAFLEVAGLGPDRGKKTGQNLVSVSEVLLPAAGLLLLTALGGTAMFGRRKKA